MSEIRKDPIVDRWVIIARERGKRPINIKVTSKALDENKCPFCPGNEDQTPPEIERISGDLNQWLVRVVPNKYPAVYTDAVFCEKTSDFFRCISGIGRHEVIIEVTDHHRLMHDYSRDHMVNVLTMYRKRYMEINKDKHVKYVIIFKNEGAEAGATIAHSHTQLIALPVVPQDILEEIDGAGKYLNEKGTCIFCDLIQREQVIRERLVLENKSFTVIAPYASRFPYETWVLPKRHNPHFYTISNLEVRDLAEILLDILRRLAWNIRHFSYNYVFHSAPFAIADDREYHWHLEIIPRTANVAGFEWGTGYYLNSVSPEEAAEKLRLTAFN